MDDIPNLPFCNAVLRELERCSPAIIDAAHVTTEDIEYEGLLIPKGAALITNTWTINHDERRFADPYKFNVRKDTLPIFDVCVPQY